MSTLSQLSTDAIARIETIDGLTTDAISEVEAYTQALANLAGSLLPPYHTPAAVTYDGTTPTFSGVPPPDLSQLDDADDAIDAAASASDGMPNLQAGTDQLPDVFRTALASPEARIDAIVADTDALIPPTRQLFEFQEDQFIADIIDEVKEKIKSSMDQTPGSSTDTEGRYYANDRARRLDSDQKELRDSTGEFSGRGFALPPGVLSDAVAYLSAKQSMDNQSAEKEIIMQQEALSLENRQKAIDAGVRYDQILLSYFEHKMQRALTTAKTLFQVGRDIAALKFAVLGGRIGVQQANLAAVSDGRRILLDEFQANTRKFGERIDGLISTAGQYLESYQAEGQVYGTMKRAAAEIARFDQSEHEIHMDVLLSNLKNGITAMGHNLDAFSAITQVRLKAAATGAETQLALTASARNSLTSVVSLLSGDSVSGSGT